ncbi:hypothetical protein Droror1_Dr00005413 [Drosera rotundifolia]
MVDFDFDRNDAVDSMGSVDRSGSVSERANPLDVGSGSASECANPLDVAKCGFDLVDESFVLIHGVVEFGNSAVDGRVSTVVSGCLVYSDFEFGFCWCLSCGWGVDLRFNTFHGIHGVKLNKIFGLVNDCCVWG